MKKLLLLAIVSCGAMYAMENQADLATFREHMDTAKDVITNVEIHRQNNTLTVPLRQQAFAQITQIIDQLHNDMQTADSLLLTKIRYDIAKIIPSCKQLRRKLLAHNQPQSQARKVIDFDETE